MTPLECNVDRLCVRGAPNAPHNTANMGTVRYSQKLRRKPQNPWLAAAHPPSACPCAARIGLRERRELAEGCLEPTAPQGRPAAVTAPRHQVLRRCFAGAVWAVLADVWLRPGSCCVSSDPSQTVPAPASALRRALIAASRRWKILARHTARPGACAAARGCSSTARTAIEMLHAFA